METFFIKALQLIVALMLLVTIHEFGHYIFARIFGIKVNRFYLFFNPWFSILKYYPSEGKMQLFAWTKKEKDPNDPEKVIEEPKALFTFKAGKPHNPVNKKGRPSWAATLYGLGWLPLGGYCDIAGMVDETKSADDLEAEPQEWEFRTKSAWKRFLVMVAGVLFNFLLAIVIYAGIAYHWGDRVTPYDKITEGMDFVEPLKQAGFADGDILLTVNGEKFDTHHRNDIWEMIQPGARVGVLRNHVDTVIITIPQATLDSLVSLRTAAVGMRVPVYIDKVQGGGGAYKADLKEGDRIIKVGNDTTPSLSEFFPALADAKSTTQTMLVVRDGKTLSIPVEISADGKIGIQLLSPDKIYPFEEIRYSLLGAIPRGWELGTNQLVTYVSSLKLLFTKEGAKQVGGFGTLGGLFPEKWDWYTFWQITAFLSVILAFMNIIPIPALDGGYVLFLFWEMITRRKPSDKFLEVANTIGFGFLLLLLLYANGNDLLRTFGIGL